MNDVYPLSGDAVAIGREGLLPIVVVRSVCGSFVLYLRREP